MSTFDQNFDKAMAAAGGGNRDKAESAPSALQGRSVRYEVVSEHNTKGTLDASIRQHGSFASALADAVDREQHSNEMLAKIHVPSGKEIRKVYSPDKGKPSTYRLVRGLEKSRWDVVWDPKAGDVFTDAPYEAIAELSQAPKSAKTPGYKPVLKIVSQAATTGTDYLGRIVRGLNRIVVVAEFRSYPMTESDAKDALATVKLWLAYVRRTGTDVEAEHTVTYFNNGVEIRAGSGKSGEDFFVFTGYPNRDIAMRAVGQLKTVALRVRQGTPWPTRRYA